ncbi:PLP-dependent transferase [Lentinus tigrinus ALCF2SS1-7]|uniref:PLP-dependent transferase n=1 Tax=Lentinus tigrinus ALCF2SS1-6 TaxID=1328759 RepID=A0A5C2SA36_9APHY|nr:PLP-dependent transferase [Lentinus tigrinus ALCF2SS1-6]RPD74707.1 PLP-dependent transferase [Lentinus tigrinus ALCF2SS1-7]
MPTPKHTPGPGETYDPTQPPPPFGHALKQYFAFKNDYINLNHGSYGSLPLPVVWASSQLAYEIESCPDIFHRLQYFEKLNKSRELLAKFVHADTDEVVLVGNATAALNTVLRNFEWREGDVIVLASTTYASAANTTRYLADRSEQPRPTIYTIEYEFPLTHAQVVDLFRSKLREVKQLHSNIQFTDVPPASTGFVDDVTMKKNKILAIVDAITANPGVLMPWQEMVRVAREEGVWTLVDGAHSIGQEPNINLSQARPDFYLSNAHKWLMGKRGCALLYVPQRNQYMIKSSVPTADEYCSPGTKAYEKRGTGFVTQHEYLGGSDVTPFLVIPEVFAFRQWLGGEEAINGYCSKLAVEGGKRLAEVMKTQVLDESGELTLNMPNVQLPLPVEKTPGELYPPELRTKINLFLQSKLLYDWKTYAAHYYHNGGFWCRCSAQVFNEVSDFEYLGRAFNALCQEVEATFLKSK